MPSPRIRRLESDFERLKSRFKNWPLIQINSFEGNPPEKYGITYNIRGLYTDENGKILERNQHTLEIRLDLEYPRRPPQCRLITPIFHPNFNETEVCAQDNYAASEGLDDLIIRIGQMIAYQFYNTKSPLNGLAAKWASENSEKLPVDAREISSPLFAAEPVIRPDSPQEVIIDTPIFKKIVVEPVLNPEPLYEKRNEFPVLNRMETDKNKDNYIDLRNVLTLIKNENYNEALDIINRVIKYNEMIKNAYYYRAIINYKIGDSPSAISDLIIAAKLGHDKAIETLNKKNIKY